MAVTSDPVATVKAGTFDRLTELKVYRGSEPSLAGFLNQAFAQGDGSAAVPCKGVGIGTEVCVYGKGGGQAVVAKGKAGEQLT
jgi:hypothetical protein